MKSIFSVKQAIGTLRDLNPSVFQKLSVTEEYELLIELIDLVIFMRRNVDQYDTARRNPAMKADPKGSHPENPGGLLKITFERQIIPYSKEEESLLFAVSKAIIWLKRAVINGNSFPFLSVQEGKQHQGAFKQTRRKKSNKHFSSLRKSHSRRK